MMRIVMYGKGKVGKGVQDLCASLGLECILMDDEDRDDTSLQAVNYIVVTPGISPNHHSVYKKYESKILSELSFIALLQKKKILPLSFSCIGVTWTNGKSTTSFIIYQAAQSLLTDTYDVYLAGNTDNSFSKILTSLLKKSVTKPILFVLEVSSFMLYNLQHFIFDIGVFINISQDHLDRHWTMDSYWESKYTIISHADLGVIGKSLVHKCPLDDKTIVTEQVSIDNPYLLWEHNQENLSVAYTALKTFMKKQNVSCADKSLKNILSTVMWMPHRLEKKIIWNVVFIDDAISTSGHSLLTALRSLDRNIILIAGWYDNKETYENLLWSLWYVSKAIFYGSNKKILSGIFQKENVECSVVLTLEEALRETFVLWKRENIPVLYSPGSKSFDQFANVYHRIEVLESLLWSMPGYLQHQ